MNEHTRILAAVAVIIVFAAVVFLVRRVAPTATINRLSSPEPFAAMVVAEIKMYHGQAVNTAFEQSAIYRLFKDDIDRSRQMFLQRFPAAETAFYVALVKILAQGQPNRLGLDYPYPRKTTVESPAEISPQRPPNSG